MEEKYQIEELMKSINVEIEKYCNYVSREAVSCGEMLCDCFDSFDDDIKKDICNEILKIIPYDYPYPAVWWLSVALKIMKSADIYIKLLRYIRKHKDAFSPNTLHYLFYQMNIYEFMNYGIADVEGKAELWKLFLDTLDKFEKKITTSLESIPMEKRNHNLIVVITEQILRVFHGPTKTAFDRCKTIKNKIGKEVLLINTAEVTSLEGYIPFAGARGGSYVDEFLERETMEWKGVMIPYLQCEQNMPDFETIDILLEQIRNLAPERIVVIGGSSIVGNLANKMIPAVSIGLCPSAFEWTSLDYMTLGRKMTHEDEALLSAVGFSKEKVIECIFTSDVKTQEEQITKKDLGIGEDVFLIAVIGGRLDDEATDEFLGMLEQVVNDKEMVVFIGIFEQYNERIKKYPKVCTYSKYLGFCNDILSRVEVCDLYVNPTRKGGGTSAVEALFKGVPVVADGYGDVATNVGPDFVVDDYEAMKKEIQRYFSDKEYYAKKSELARKRCEVLLDTDGEFVRILEEVERREREQTNRQ